MFRDAAKEGMLTVITKKPIVPTHAEAKKSPRAQRKIARRRKDIRIRKSCFNVSIMKTVLSYAHTYEGFHREYARIVFAMFVALFLIMLLSYGYFLKSAAFSAARWEKWPSNARRPLVGSVGTGNRLSGADSISRHGESECPRTPRNEIFGICGARLR